MDGAASWMKSNRSEVPQLYMDRKMFMGHVHPKLPVKTKLDQV